MSTLGSILFSGISLYRVTNEASLMHNSQARFFGYDLIKTIAISMIVFYHLGGIDYGAIEPGHFYLPNLNKFFSALCAAGVPLFFMVNGALVIPKNLHWKQLLFKVFHLLFLFVFWKFVLQYLISFKLLAIEDKMVHFWFLCTLSIVYLMSIVLQKSTFLRHAVLVFLFLFPFCYNFLWNVVLFFAPSFDACTVVHTGFFTLYGVLYYYLGGSLGTRHTSSLYAIGLIVFGLLLVNFEVVAMSNHYHAIYDGVNSTFPTLGALAMSVGIFIIFKDVSFNDGIARNIVSYVGQNTMGIFLFHVLVIFLLRQFSPSIFVNLNFWTSLLLSVLIILCTAFISSLINHSRLAFLLTLSYKS